MKARYRDLTEKYKNCRLQPEPLFLSRTLQTFFNKFTKKGKKALARRHIRNAFSQLRLSLRLPTGATIIKRTLRDLEAPLALLYGRSGKERKIVPVPRRRNKKKSAGFQILYRSRQQRRERDFSERLCQERLFAVGPIQQSPVRRRRSAQFLNLYENRRNTETR